jgi:eukaryotic-like serine/threonine-protein kinase
MPIVDSPNFRLVLQHFFPAIAIESNLRPSGQRLVYFCSFGKSGALPSQATWADWGKVVLKVSEDVHPTVIARLEKEREILNSLNSGYFPRLLYYDVFASDPVTELKLPNRLYITLEERVVGQPLSDCRPRFVTESSVGALILEMVRGLSLLWEHPQRIIHRDLKPDNILIRENGDPVIIDLGIMREQGTPGLTGSHWQIGPCTPAYASPEQLKNEKRFITYRSDFFALGVIAYELLSGSNPFMQSTVEPLELVVNRALTFHPPALHDIGRASLDFSRVVQRLMSKEPYQRYRTVREFTTALVALFEDA